MNPICTNFFPSSTSASTTSSAASALSASGFSQSTGFSAFRHSSTSGAWVGSGEAITTASTFSSRIRSAPSVKTAAEPCCCSANFSALSESTSETAANLAFATIVWRFSACMPPMPPVPITPTAICSGFPICSSFCSVAFGRSPLPALHATLDRVYDHLATVAVPEGRPRPLASLYPIEKVFDGMHEGVLVSDDVPWRPPPCHVRVLRLGDEERAETGRLRLVVLEVHLQFVHPLQVEVE